MAFASAALAAERQCWADAAGGRSNMNASRLLVAVLLWPSATLVAAEHVPWRWARQIPTEVTTTKPAANRKAQEVDALFKGGLTVQKVLAQLGQADGFSRQSIHTRKSGSAADARGGGTLRFLLDNGEELHVWSGDLTHVHLAMRYSRNGKAHLVFK